LAVARCLCRSFLVAGVWLGFVQVVWTVLETSEQWCPYGDPWNWGSMEDS
jgi:hypothetical protein